MKARIEKNKIEKPFQIVTHKFAVEEFTEIAEKLKHKYLPMPKALLSPREYPQYKCISLYGKLLYSFMLNRALDWTDNPWHKGLQHYNTNDEVYVSYPIEETMDLLQCGKKKALQVYKELLYLGMIEEKIAENEYYVYYNEDMLKYKDINC